LNETAIKKDASTRKFVETKDGTSILVPLYVKTPGKIRNLDSKKKSLQEKQKNSQAL